MAEREDGETYYRLAAVRRDWRTEPLHAGMSSLWARPETVTRFGMTPALAGSTSTSAGDARRLSSDANFVVRLGMDGWSRQV